MGSLAITLLASLFLGSAALEQDGWRVFLDKRDASAVMPRHRRANEGNEENLQSPNLERECVEEVCSYEEAREIFQDTYRTDIFWSVYVDGDQCAGNPCKNGAMCSDSVGGYDCICKTGYLGVHCETDQTVCIPDKTKGCSQFCKPGYVSYECSCAPGWKLEGSEKCVPAGPYPCGKVESLSQWDSRRSVNIRSNYEGLSCDSGECPWQAQLQSLEIPNGYCSGAILKNNLVLTTAQCASMYKNFQVAVGKRAKEFEEGEQVIYVKAVHVHPKYKLGLPDNDLAVVELRNQIAFKKSALPACLPERDFADAVLMTGEHEAVVSGWKTALNSTVQEEGLAYNHLAYQPLAECVERHPGRVTSKMFCTAVRRKADCWLGPGSPALTLYREVFFLTGLVSQPVDHDCSQGYVFQKVSRYLSWLKPLVETL